MYIHILGVQPYTHPGDTQQLSTMDPSFDCLVTHFRKGRQADSHTSIIVLRVDDQHQRGGVGALGQLLDLQFLANVVRSVCLGEMKKRIPLPHTVS